MWPVNDNYIGRLGAKVIVVNHAGSKIAKIAKTRRGFRLARTSSENRGLLKPGQKPTLFATIL